MDADFDRDRRQVCVVVDTCVWRSNPLLKTPLGLTLIYTVNRLKGVIGLPEVVELELKNQIIEAGMDAISKVEDHCGRIDLLTDASLRQLLPSREVLESQVEATLTKLEPIFVREPFTLEHAKAALRMVNEKLPPNGSGNQQFKDSAIWLALLSLARRFSTHFITNDKAFFKQRDPKLGLAPNLMADCQREGVNVRVHWEIASCLEAIVGDKPEFDQSLVGNLILAEVMPRLEVEAKRLGLVLAKVTGTEMDAFRTELPNRIAIDYALAMTL
jgi:hypothetical protein